MGNVRSDIGPFAIAPEWLIDAGVSAGALHLYVVLGLYADRDSGECWPSRHTLSVRMGCSVDTVDRRMRELAARGAVTVEQRRAEDGDQDTNLYVVHTVRPPSRTVAATGSRDAAATPSRTVAAQNQNHSEPEPVEPVPPRTRRRTARDDYFDVLVEVYGQPTPRSGAAFYSRVVTDVMAMPDATPDELRRRALLARQRYGKKSTPEAVVKHWPMLAQQSSRFDQWAEHAHQEGTTC